MDENRHRVEQIKKALNCKTDKKLADRLQSHPPNISRWKQRGFYPIIANLIDELLKQIQKQKKQTSQDMDIQLASISNKKLEQIKAVSGKSTNTIIDDAIEQYYETVMIHRISDLTQQIVGAHKNLSEKETLPLYCELLKVLRYTYDTAEGLKTALTRFGVPFTSGETGKWRVAGVRSLIKRCSLGID